jgi:Rrf2 family protein
MNVSALEEYGLRCALRLASTAPDETLSASQIAESEGLSVEYVSKFMLYLKKADLVRTVRGIHGGFALSRDPSQITLKEVFDALSSKRKFSEEFCNSFSGKTGECVRLDGCSIRPFWKMLAQTVDEFTSKWTLQDLLELPKKTPQADRNKHIERIKKESEVLA